MLSLFLFVKRDPPPRRQTRRMPSQKNPTVSDQGPVAPLYAEPKLTFCRRQQSFFFRVVEGSVEYGKIWERGLKCYRLFSSFYCFIKIKILKDILRSKRERDKKIIILISLFFKKPKTNYIFFLHFFLILILK